VQLATATRTAGNRSLADKTVHRISPTSEVALAKWRPEKLPPALGRPSPISGLSVIRTERSEVDGESRRHRGHRLTPDSRGARKAIFSSWPSMTVPRDAVCAAIAVSVGRTSCEQIRSASWRRAGAPDPVQSVALLSCRRGRTRTSGHASRPVGPCGMLVRSSKFARKSE